MSPAGGEGKRVEVERPETLPRVRAKLAEGEQFFHALAAKVDVMRERMDHLADGQRQTRSDVAELRADLREHERTNAKRDAETRAELRAVSGEVAAMRRDMDARLDAIERALTYRAGIEVGGGPVSPGGAQADDASAPRLASPLTSAGQARRAAVVGGGGVGLATILGAVGALASLPPPLQWALVALAVIAGVGAIAVAVRWGWTAAGR